MRDRRIPYLSTHIAIGEHRIYWGKSKQILRPQITMAWMQIGVSVIAICIFTGSCQESMNRTARKLPPRDDSDAKLSTPELIVKYGYPVESHTVVTEDGYILNLHRIPHGRNQSLDESRLPVLLEHGLMGSSAAWVMMGPEISLGYLLADAGYDVWLSNARGNTYSRNHMTVDPNTTEFWQFSWHEKGKYDLPAEIDYILNKRNVEKLFYIGYSESTTTFYVMASELPEYNDKIRTMISLAPIAFMSSMKSPLVRLIATMGGNLDWLMDLMGGYEFLAHAELMSMIGGKACDDEAMTDDLCSNAIFLICGFDSEQLDAAMMPTIQGHIPAGTSTMEFLHYAQEVNSGKFCQYDRGMIKNIWYYGHFSPPEYNLSRITAPVALFYSENDWLASISDVEQLFINLGNPIGKFKVPFSKFNHLDFMWALDAPELVYKDVIKLMRSY